MAAATRPGMVSSPADRPRERLQRVGAHGLPDTELLSVVLGLGSTSVAQGLVQRFPDLRRMASAGVAELAAVRGVGVAQACRIKAALALAGRLGDRPLARGEPLTGPRELYDRVGRRLAHLEREVFVGVALDTKHRVLAEVTLAEGGVCSVEVIPRDVFAVLVREAAAAAAFVHNHPSGDPTPSEADGRLTRRLAEVGELLGITVVDHVVAAAEGYHSFSSELSRARR
jgi:DNA repair protein RadC